MSTSSVFTAPAAHGPIAVGQEADRLRATAAALTALAAAGSWTLARVLVSVATDGEASISDLSVRLKTPVAGIAWAVRLASTGRFIRPKDPAEAGRVLPPKLPGGLHVRRGETCNSLIVSLAPAGLALVRALQGNWEDDSDSSLETARNQGLARSQDES